MNRELKFRVFFDGKMYYSDEKLNSLSSYYFMIDLDGKLWLYSEDEENPSLLIRDCVLMQFTGLKDKNGKEIYEGDVVKYIGKSYKHYKPLRDYGIVRDENTAFRVHGFILFELSDGLEIIGNIFENPEMMPENWIDKDEGGLENCPPGIIINDPENSKKYIKTEDGWIIQSVKQKNEKGGC